MKHAAIRFLVAFFCALVATPALTVTALQPGDIAIIGFDGKSPDDFAFVNLVPIDAETSVSFTLINSSNVVWSSPAGGVAEGTVIVVLNPKTAPASTIGTVTATGYNYESNGDAILVRQGGTNLFVSETVAAYSLPTGLAYTNSTAINHPEAPAVAKNGRYNGPRSGTRQNLLAAISSTNNWNYLDADPGYAFNQNPYNQPFTIIPDSTSNLTWIGTVADGYRARNSRSGNNLSTLGIVSNVLTDNNDALTSVECYAMPAASISSRSWFSVFFTNDCPSNIIISSVKILVQEQGPPGQTGTNTIFVSSDRTVSRWYAGEKGLPTTNSGAYTWSSQETNILYDVTAVLDTYQKITNCEVLVLNKGVSNLYFDVIQLLVEYPLIGPPAIKNTGATLVQPASATLNGEITAGGPPPVVWMYWGDNDGSNNATTWDTGVNLGTRAVGAVSTPITGLLANRTYYYRFYATNSHGDAWAASTASFTTPPPSIGFTTASNSGPESAAAVFEVTLSHPSAVPMSVDYTAAGGTATGGGVDYTLASGTLVVPAGVVSTNITALIIDDGMNESNEFFVVSLANPVPANTPLDISAEMYTIIDNDTNLPSVTFTAGSFSADENDSNAVVNVSLLQPSGKPVQITLTTANGTALDGSDYTNTTETITWDPGTTGVRSFLVPLINDTTSEQPESFYVLLSAPSNCTISGSSSTRVDVVDDDFGPPSLRNDEGATGVTSNSAILRGWLTSTGGANTSVSLYYGTTDGGSNSAAWGPPRNLGVLEVGHFSNTVSGLNGNTRYFYRCAASNVNGMAWAPASTNFLTGPPTLSFTLTNTVRSETVGAVTVEVSIKNPSVYGLPVSVAYSAVGGSASNGADYTLATNVVTIPAGTNRAYITVTLTNDVFNEPEETVVLSLSNTVNAVLGSPVLHTLTITDNDPLPVLSFSGTPYSVNENGTQAVIRVALVPLSGRTVRVAYSTADGTAANGLHYTEVSGTLTWLPGDASEKTFAVPIIDNALREGNRGFFVVLSAASNATLAYISEPVTIMEDDVLPPEVDNDGGASNIEARTAVLHGTVLSGVPPPVAAFYWGPTDGGTNRTDWSNRVDVGMQSGAFSAPLTGLLTNKLYYYRASATNAGGFAWAPATTNFTTIAAHDYYVNNGSTSNDMYCKAIGKISNDGLTPFTPKASLQALLDSYELQPGDTVFIDTGTYTLSATISIAATNTGSPGLPVLFVGSTNQTGTTLDHNDSGGNVIEFTVPGGGNIRFQNLRFTGGSLNGLLIEGSSENHCRNVEVINCRASGNPYGEGGIVCRWADNVRILDSLCEDNGSSGLLLEYCVNPLVQGSSFSGNVYYGVWMNFCTSPVLRGNRMFAQNYYGIAAFDGSGELIETNECFGNGSAGIRLSSSNPTLTGNACYSNSYDGISVDGVASLQGNSAYANGRYGIFLEGGAGLHTVHHNLAYANADYALYVDSLNNVVDAQNNTLRGGNGAYFRDPLQIVFSNNIVHASGSANIGVVLASSPGEGRFAADYNDLFASGGATVGSWGGTDCPTLEAWQTASSTDSRSISMDPLFVNPERGDYHLQSKAGSYHSGTWLPDAANSPCIDAADPWSAFDLEPGFNGLTMNQGAYGNTAQASKTQYAGPFYAVTLVTNPPTAGTVTIQPAADVYPTNRLLWVRAVATSTNYPWSQWGGSLTGTDPTHYFYATSNIVAEAIFAGQRTPLEVWMEGHDIADQNADPDHDGATTIEEYRAGTDPTNAASTFRILRFGTQNGSNYVTWYATTNSGVTTPFLLYGATNLVPKTPLLITNNILRASDGTNTWWLPQPTGKVWFFWPSIPDSAP